MKKLQICSVQLAALCFAALPIYAAQEPAPTLRNNTNLKSDYPAKSVEGERIFRLYKASIFRSSKMYDHLDKLARHFERSTGKSVNSDDLIWSLIVSLIAGEHLPISKAGSYSDLISRIQQSKHKHFDSSDSVEAHLELTKLARELLDNYRGYERKIAEINKHKSRAPYQTDSSLDDKRKAELAKGLYRDKLIQIAGLKAVEQMQGSVVKSD